MPTADDVATALKRLDDIEVRVGKVESKVAELATVLCKALEIIKKERSVR